MKTNVQRKIERELNEQRSKLEKIPYKSSFIKSKLKVIMLIREIIKGNSLYIELLESIEEKYIFFSIAYDIADELTSEIEAEELTQYEIKNAEEIINKLNLEVK